MDIIMLIGLSFPFLCAAFYSFRVAFKEARGPGSFIGIFSVGCAFLSIVPVTILVTDSSSTFLEALLDMGIIFGVFILISVGPYLIFATCRHIYRRVKKAAIKHREKKEIRRKSKEIARGNRHLQRDLKEYAKLAKANTVPIADIELSGRFVDLLEKVDVDSEYISKFRTAINDRRNSCLRQQELEKKILILAEHYDEVGDTTSAEKLRRQLREIA